MFDHDYTYCSDYDIEKCPKTCFRAEVTQEFRDELKNAGDSWGTISVLASWSHFKNTEQCPLANIETTHGYWIDTEFGWLCSVCDKVVGGYNKFNFCPHCGAKMDSKVPTPSIKRAHWIWNTEVRCSACNYKLETTGIPNICPNCKAKMD